MDGFYTPNGMFLLVLVALLVSVFAVLVPGSGFWEGLATVSWLAVVVLLWGRPVRWWALVLFLMAFLPLVLFLRHPERAFWLALAGVLLVLGAVFLLPAEKQWIDVHPLLVLVAGGGFVALLTWGGRKITEALRHPEHFQPLVVEGEIGVARTDVHLEGTVYVAGELWSARSERPIPKGARVRVVRREGLILWVEPVDAPLAEQAE